jgi:hypothetical protein
MMAFHAFHDPFQDEAQSEAGKNRSADLDYGDQGSALPTDGAGANQGDFG